MSVHWDEIHKHAQNKTKLYMSGALDEGRGPRSHTRLFWLLPYSRGPQKLISFSARKNLHNSNLMAEKQFRILRVALCHQMCTTAQHCAQPDCLRANLILGIVGGADKRLCKGNKTQGFGSFSNSTPFHLKTFVFLAQICAKQPACRQDMFNFFSVVLSWNLICFCSVQCYGTMPVVKKALSGRRNSMLGEKFLTLTKPKAVIFNARRRRRQTGSVLKQEKKENSSSIMLTSFTLVVVYMQASACKWYSPKLPPRRAIVRRI